MKCFLRDRLVLGLALVTCLGLGVAFAQNINKSVQLSQDSSGPIGFDTLNNVYFPAHILSTGLAGIPAVTALVGTPTILSSSTDFIGQITGASGPLVTTGSITFKTAFNAAPVCLLILSGGTASTLAWNAVATGINITSGIGSGVINYLCSGQK